MGRPPIRIGGEPVAMEESDLNRDEGAATPRRGGCRRWLARLGCAALVVVVAVLGWLVWELAAWPDVAALAEENPATTAFIELNREQARKEGRQAVIRWEWVPYERISPHLKRAVLVAEDINFFSHDGFEVDELRSAIADALESGGKLRGASTLTQQLAKNLFLSPERSLERKAREAILTMQLERHLEKRRILELYLNVAQFGPGIFGAEAASRRYFDKPAATLTPAEAAALAAALPRPSYWHPGAGSRAYQARVRSIERRMDRATWLWDVL